MRLGNEPDRHPRRIAAHERHEQATEFQEADRIDIAGDSGHTDCEEPVPATIARHAAPSASASKARLPRRFQSASTSPASSPRPRPASSSIAPYGVARSSAVRTTRPAFWPGPERKIVVWGKRVVVRVDI